MNKATGTTEEEEMKSTIPIYLCVNIDGNRTYKATGYKVERKYWDSNKELVKSTHKIAAHINAGLIINNHPLRRWIESIGQSPLYVSDGGENKSKFLV